MRMDSLHTRRSPASVLMVLIMAAASGAALGSGLFEDGASVYREVCSSCHGPGPVAAPKYGDAAAWKPLIEEGQHVITAHGWVGVREMPPRGGEPELRLEEFGRAVAHMANSAGAGWSDPSDNAVLLGKIRVEEADRRRKLSQADAGLETRKYD
jgi:cytochrome c5